MIELCGDQKENKKETIENFFKFILKVTITNKYKLKF